MRGSTVVLVVLVLPPVRFQTGPTLGQLGLDRTGPRQHYSLTLGLVIMLSIFISLITRFVSLTYMSPTGSRLLVGSPNAGSLSLHPPPSPHTSQPGPSEDRFPPGFSPNTLSSIGNQQNPPESPARDPVTRPPPSLEPSPDQFWNTLLEGSGSHQLHSASDPGPSEDRFPPGFSPNTLSSIDNQRNPPVTRPPPSLELLPDQFRNTLLEGSGSPQLHPGPSEGRFPSPPGGSVNPDTLPPISTGSQPPPPAHEVTRPPSPGQLLKEYWDALIKSKFKRRISGPVL